MPSARTAAAPAATSSRKRRLAPMIQRNICLLPRPRTASASHGVTRPAAEQAAAVPGFLPPSRCETCPPGQPVPQQDQSLPRRGFTLIPKAAVVLDFSYDRTSSPALQLLRACNFSPGEGTPMTGSLMRLLLIEDDVQLLGILQRGVAERATARAVLVVETGDAGAARRMAVQAGEGTPAIRRALPVGLVE